MAAALAECRMGLVSIGWTILTLLTLCCWNCYVDASSVPPPPPLPIHSTTTDIVMKDCSVYGEGVPGQSELEDVYENAQ